MDEARRETSAKRERARARLEPIGRLFDRLPPHSLEAEMSLLGSMILDPSVIADLISIVHKPEDFFSTKHGAIFRALVDLYDKHASGDLVQLQDMLRTRGVLEEIGGDDYLLRLASGVPSSVNAPHYARIVAEKAKLRRLIDAAGQILYDAFHAGDAAPDGAREVLDAAEMAIFEIAQDDIASDPQKLAELLHLEIERMEANEGKGLSGLASGFSDLDSLLRGFQPGEMIVLAARPSMGKTALALNLAEQVARGGRTPWQGTAKGPEVGVGFFSLEMSKSAVALRLLSAVSGISVHNLRSGERLGDMGKVLDACEALREARIFIDDTPGLSVLALRARARRMVAQHDIRLILVDYLQLMSAPSAARESRQVEVSAISRGIKGLARELNIPVVCLSQLNRASEQREGNRPRMSDLRESGSIEQDADVVMLLHRESYFHAGDPEWAENNPAKVNLAELIVAKQRNGPTGVVELLWDNSITRFKSHVGGAHENPWAAEAKPLHASPSASFPARPATGPVSNFRDGGGPDAPFDDDDTGGLPI